MIAQGVGIVGCVAQQLRRPHPFSHQGERLWRQFAERSTQGSVQGVAEIILMRAVQQALTLGPTDQQRHIRHQLDHMQGHGAVLGRWRMRIVRVPP